MFNYNVVDVNSNFLVTYDQISNAVREVVDEAKKNNLKGAGVGGALVAASIPTAVLTAGVSLLGLIPVAFVAAGAVASQFTPEKLEFDKFCKAVEELEGNKDDPAQVLLYRYLTEKNGDTSATSCKYKLVAKFLEISENLKGYEKYVEQLKTLASVKTYLSDKKDFYEDECQTNLSDDSEVKTVLEQLYEFGSSSYTPEEKKSKAKEYMQNKVSQMSYNVACELKRELPKLTQEGKALAYLRQETGFGYYFVGQFGNTTTYKTIMGELDKVIAVSANDSQSFELPPLTR